MAIVKMKKLRVMGMSEDREALLNGLMRLGCVEVSEPEGGQSEAAWSGLLERGRSRLSKAREEQAAAETALSALRKYGEQKDGMFIKRRPITEEEFLSAGTVEEARGISEAINGRLQELVRLEGEENRLQVREAGLEPWRGLDLALETEGTEHVEFRLMVCPGAVDIDAVKAELQETGAAAELTEVSADKQQRYELLICHRSDEEQAMEILRPRGFSVTGFQGLTGTAAWNLQQVRAALTENRRKQAAAGEAIASYAGRREALRIYADRLNAEVSRERAAERLLTDGTIVFFEGWVPEENLEEVSSLLEKQGCAWESEDPAEEEYAAVPVKLKNNWLTKPLNMVTEMYSLPSYDGIDPNPLMAPFFILFYGIMMADMAYGLLMFAAGMFVTWKYHPKGTAGHLFGLLTLCGVSTFIMGALTGGFLGDFLTQAAGLCGGAIELPALFTPLGDTMAILVGCMGLGVIQIVTGMAISLVRKIRRGRLADALWEEVTWWVVFAGIGCTALGVTNVVLYVGMAMVLVGSGWNAKGIGKVTAVFGSLYNHVTGYFGDILSYSRLMALMLAGSVIAQVFNTLGAIVGNLIVFVVISLVGNALNFALNLLSCYVHDLRLQCLEYFNKFYQDGGRPFRPLKMDTKYVDIQ